MATRAAMVMLAWTHASALDLNGMYYHLQLIYTVGGTGCTRVCVVEVLYLVSRI